MNGIWIRAQNGGLYFCDRIDNILRSQEEPAIYNHLPNGNYDILGKYNSYIRTNEVLTDIAESISEGKTFFEMPSI